MGKLVSIAYTPADIDPRPSDHYARIPVESATLEAGRGIVGDRKGKGRKRHLNVMAESTLDQLNGEGYRTASGQMGEQLVVAGIDVNRLAPGTRLRLGDESVIEVVEARTGCDRLQRVQGCTPDRVTGRLGVMACVRVGGTIRVGDPVLVLDSE